MKNKLDIKYSITHSSKRKSKEIRKYIKVHVNKMHHIKICVINSNGAQREFMAIDDHNRKYMLGKTLYFTLKIYFTLKKNYMTVIIDV